MRNEAHIQSIQSLYAAFGRGDVPGILRHLADGILWIHTGAPELPYGKVYRGKAEVAQFFEDLSGVLEFPVFDPHTFISDGDRVIVLGRYEARSFCTGRQAADDWAMAWTFQDGKVVRYQAYVDTLSGAKALGAVAV